MRQSPRHSCRSFSPAKINLHLRVGPVRSDGFHPLVSWMVTVGLFDTLDFALDAAGRVTLVSSDPALPVDDRNLIVRAARLLQAEAMNASATHSVAEDIATAWEQSGRPGVSVRAVKVIPSGGGLGGGSSDAATTLLTLNDLWELKFDLHRLTAIAAKLGSDVPFFLNGPSSVCEGRGEIVRKIGPPAVCKWVLLMLPAISMPTPAVYQRFDAMHEPDSAPDWKPIPWDLAVDWSQWRTMVAEELLRVLRNDLEPPAFDLVPELAQLRASAERIAARPVRMSGSGSTLFTLFDTKSEALKTESEIQRQLSGRIPSVKTVVAPLAPDATSDPSGA